VQEPFSNKDKLYLSKKEWREKPWPDSTENKVVQESDCWKHFFGKHSPKSTQMVFVSVTELEQEPQRKAVPAQTALAPAYYFYN
jgi:hypothetical protein